ncbi:MAG: hypothetical protein ABI553_08050 [Chloroflexota bacterium]
MTGALHGRDDHQVEALVTDRYLEALLAAHARGADRGPSSVEPAEPIQRAAERLARDLPRLHPSFRFEEALAGRLADVAVRMRLPHAAGAGDLAVPLPIGDAYLGLDDDDAGDPRIRRARHPIIIGGALTSAALSIAGAAYIAWRRRPPSSPMVRAARAVARTRPV